MINEYNAYILLAGNAKKMPNDVYNTLLNIIEQYGNKTKEQAEIYLKQLTKTNKFQMETWA